MKTVVRWFAQPRLNYIDCITVALMIVLAPSIGWWVVAIFWVGIVISTVVERAVWR